MRIPSSTPSPSPLVPPLVPPGVPLAAHPDAEALGGVATFITPRAER